MLRRQAARRPSDSHPTKRASSDRAPPWPEIASSRLVWLRDCSPSWSENRRGIPRINTFGPGRSPGGSVRLQSDQVAIPYIRSAIHFWGGCPSSRCRRSPGPGRPRSRRSTGCWLARTRRTASTGLHDLPFLPADHLWFPYRGIRKTASRRSPVVQTNPHPSSRPAGSVNRAVWRSRVEGGRRCGRAAELAGPRPSRSSRRATGRGRSFRSGPQPAPVNDRFTLPLERIQGSHARPLDPEDPALPVVDDQVPDVH